MSDKPKMFHSSIDIPEDKRTELVGLLNQQLADTFDLFSQAKQAHWNVKGPQFIALHELYDMIAEGLIPYIDMVAERITALGGVAMGTVQMAAQSTRLDDYPGGGVGSMESVEELCERVSQVGESTRAAADKAEELKDMDTNDMFIEISRDLDKWLWFLEAHLQGK